MAVYGRIEEVSETIQSDGIENRLDRTLNRIWKRRAPSFPVFQTHHWKYDCNVFSVVIPLLLDMVSPLRRRLYIGGFTSGRTALQ